MSYLDYAATAIPKYKVSDYNYHWFNPNSYYAINEVMSFGKCEQDVKDSIGAKFGKVIFGGNTSWFFEKLYNIKPNFWLCSPYEHDCIYKNGLEVVDLNKIYLNNEIYCHQFVNNITGQIFPVDKIGEKVKKDGGYFICDATAGIGKAVIPNNIDDWCDCFVCSSHKLGVDNKQIGFAWISDRFYDWLQLDCSVVNGYGLVDGTPDLACAKATTDAVIDACRGAEKNKQHYYNLVCHLPDKLLDSKIKYEHVFIHTNCSSAINAIILPNINADALCNYLATVHKVYVSPGHSACEENSDYRILKQYGLTQEECESTIRVSFGPETTKSDIDALVNGIIKFKEEYIID